MSTLRANSWIHEFTWIYHVKCVYMCDGMLAGKGQVQTVADKEKWIWRALVASRSMAHSCCAVFITVKIWSVLGMFVVAGLGRTMNDKNTGDVEIQQRKAADDSRDIQELCFRISLRSLVVKEKMTQWWHPEFWLSKQEDGGTIYLKKKKDPGRRQGFQEQIT